MDDDVCFGIGVLGRKEYTQRKKDVSCLIIKNVNSSLCCVIL